MTKTRKYASLVVGVLATVVFGSASAHAQSADALIDKLVDKGILTVKEANELREEADKDFNRSYQVKTGLPDWVNSLKWSGDFRGRYDGIYQDSDNFGPTPGLPNTYANHDRTRFRYRARFGATVSMTDGLELGLRLGSGEVGSAAPSLGGSIFSANTTLNNDGSRKFIFVDAAYAKWTPKDWFTMQFGKMDSMFWITDAIIDYDYQPEGAQERFTLAMSDDQKINFTSGQFVIAENYNANGVGPNNDAYLFINQVDWTGKWTPKFSTRFALAMMNFKNQFEIPASLQTFINQNGTPASGIGAQNFNPVIARGEATYALESFPMFNGEFPITLGAEYANNPAASSAPFPGKNYAGAANQAYNLGVVFGSVKQKGNWQIAYNYKTIETASTWNGLVDDDFGFNAKGGTDVRGHHIKAWYRPLDPLTLVVSYFITEQINNVPGTQAHQQRLFIDAMLSF
jgi:Putative porin